MVKRPYIDLKKYMSAIVHLYDAMAQAYNSSIESTGNKCHSKGLKSSHRELYLDLIRTLKGDFALEDYKIKSYDDLPYIDFWQKPLIISTNRKKQKLRTLKSESSIYRLTNRLIEAGIILQKIHHGVKRDYELILNPDLIPISDLSNKEMNPLQLIFQKTKSDIVKSALRSFCTPYSKNKNYFNNKIITTNDQEPKKESDSPTSYNDPLNRRDERTLTSLLAHLQTSFANNQAMKEKRHEPDKVAPTATYAQKLNRLREIEENRKIRWGVMLADEVISALFGDRTIYPSEREAAHRNAQKFFENKVSDAVCLALMVEYRERIKMVKNYLFRNQDFNFSNIWPARYLDIENYQSGFVMTQKWYANYKKYKDLQYKTRKLVTEDSILNYAVKRFLKHKNKSSFFYWKKYVQNKAPTKIEQYESIVGAILKI